MCVVCVWVWCVYVCVCVSRQTYIKYSLKSRFLVDLCTEWHRVWGVQGACVVEVRVVLLSLARNDQDYY